jgi:hypothetical protein
MPSPVRLLTRHFFRRFFENDLISPAGDAHVGLSQVVGAFLTPGLLVVILVILKYALVRTTWQHVIDLAFDDVLLYVALSMIVLGIAATITWDAFFLEARDHFILGVLPVGHRALATAKLCALAVFLAIFVCAANLVPTALVPILMLQRAYDVTFLHHFLPLTAAHGAATLLSGTWMVLTVVALRGMAAFILPAGVFRRVGPFVQGGLILALLAWFVSLPQFLHAGRAMFDAGGWVRDLSPPMWFLGLYETVVGQPQPVFHALARTAVAATALTALLAAVLVFAALAGRRADAQASAVALSGGAGAVTRWLRRAGNRFLASPLGRATFTFTLAGLRRSATHRIYFAAAIGAALAWSFSGFFWTYTESGMDGLRQPGSATLAMQPIVVLFLVVAVRFAITVPLTLPANWLFRVTEGSPVGQYHAGTRAAAVVVGLTAVVALVPVHATLWTADVVAYHALVGVLYVLFVVEALFAWQEKVPFTAVYVSGSIRLKTRWLLYLFGASTLTTVPAIYESRALLYGRSAVWLPVGLAVATGVLAAMRRRREADLPGLVFDDSDADLPQTLGLYE